LNEEIYSIDLEKENNLQKGKNVYPFQGKGG
jgi:hypothetical protein